MSVHSEPLNEQDWDEVYDLQAALAEYADELSDRFDAGECDLDD